METEALSKREGGPTLGRSFRIEVTEAGPYTAELRSPFFDAYLVLRDAQGAVLDEDDDGLVGTQSRIVFDAQPGVPLVVEACALRGGRGTFELTLRAGRPGALDERQRQAASVEDLRHCLTLREATLGAEHPDVATALDGLATELQAQADYDAARPLFERALAIREKVLAPDDPELAGSLNNLALLLSLQGDAAAARPLYERSLAMLEQALGPDHPGVAIALANLAVLIQSQGDFVGARPLYERALAIDERAFGPDDPSVALDLDNLAGLLYQQGDYAGARPLFERALAIRESTLDPGHPDVAATLNNLGTLREALGDYAGARPLLERAVAIREAALGPEHPDLAQSLSNLGGCLRDQGDPAAARLLFERALAIDEQALGPDHPAVAELLDNLGIVLERHGEYAAALPLYQRALAISETVWGPEHPAVARSLNNMALLLAAQGEAAAARPLYERALAIDEQAFGPEHPQVSAALNNLARLLAAQGDHAGARPLFERALAINEKLLGRDHPEVATNLNNLALSVAAAGEPDAARAMLERAIAIAETALGPDHPDVLQDVSNLLVLDLDRGDRAAVETLAARAAAAQRSGTASYVLRLSEDAARDYLTTVAWQTELIQSPAVWQGQPRLACESLLAWKGQILRAARASRSVLRGKLSPETLALMEQLRDVTGLLSRGATDMARGAPEPQADPRRLADLIDERGRLERQVASRTAGLLPQAPTWPQLRDALPERAALVDFFVHRSYEPAQPAQPAEAAEAAEAAGGPAPGTVQARVARGRWTEPHVTAWITRPDAEQPAWVDLGPVPAIESGIHALLDSLVGRRGVAVSERADPGPALRALVWDPLASQLEGIDTVLVSPDGVLGTLPFEILRGGDGRYLVEDRSFVYLTDPTECAQLARVADRAQASLLAVGGIDYRKAEAASSDAPLTSGSSSSSSSSSSPSSSSAAPLVPGEPLIAKAAASNLPRGGWTDIWEPLPESKGEALRIGARHEAAFPDGQRQLVIGAAATEEQLTALLPRFSVVHLATHAYFNPEGLPSLSPGLLSGLVCAGANAALPPDREDGYLTAQEVGWLDLSGLDLVVLSACDTGLGRPQSGEGLIGLRRAFLVAGARTVVSSLWSVPDQETAELMDSFYRGLWQKQLGKHAALRAAQLEMITRNRQRYDGDARPVTWGAFVLDGDWR